MSLQTKREWLLPKKRSGDILEDIFKIRKIENRKDFLDPKLDNIPSYKKLFDSKGASRKIIEHIKKGSKIIIHGDYDADGICAIALLWEFLYRDVSRHLKTEVDILPYIPDRTEQGYGLTRESLKDMVDLNADLVITVDCGVRDKELIEEFSREKNLDFVVTDHHQPPSDILNNLTFSLVHPMYPKKEYPFTEISGTAVVYLLIQSLQSELKMSTDPTQGLDLVALSTVTDIMPLLDVNRIFVKLGLEEIRKSDRIGLKVLSLRAGLNPKDIDTYHLGYVLGPRINASGRIASPMDSVRLLVSKNEKQCKEIAEILETNNFKRQQMTYEMLEEAREIAKIDKEKILFVLGQDWHDGIIGLVAGKLQEEYYKPVIMVTKKDDVVKGSCRSIDGFNITELLEKHKKYLTRYGGHELAAGFTTTEENFFSFQKKALEYASKKITVDMLKPVLKVEILLDSNDVTKELVSELEQLEPLGFGNPKPLLCMRNLEVRSKQVMGKEGNHLKLLVKGDEVDSVTLTLFSCNEDTELLNEASKIDVVGYPNINIWNGVESVQFNVKEWRYSNI